MLVLKANKKNVQVAIMVLATDNHPNSKLITDYGLEGAGRITMDCYLIHISKLHALPEGHVLMHKEMGFTWIDKLRTDIEVHSTQGGQLQISYKDCATTTGRASSSHRQ
jgi:hypothetical protein